MKQKIQKNMALSSINMYVVETHTTIREILNALKKNHYSKDSLNEIRKDYINAKPKIEEKKREYEEILNQNIEKYKKNDKDYIDAKAKLEEKIREYKKILNITKKEDEDNKKIKNKIYSPTKDIEEYTNIAENYFKIINKKFENKDNGSDKKINVISNAIKNTEKYIKELNEKLENKDSNIENLKCYISKNIKDIENLIIWFNTEIQIRNKVTDNLINEISNNIKNAEKCIKIIDEKFENYENQNKIDKNEKKI